MTMMDELPHGLHRIIYREHTYLITSEESDAFATQYGPDVALGLNAEIAKYMFLLGLGRFDQDLPPLPEVS